MEQSKAFIAAKKEIEALYVQHGSPARDSGDDATTETKGFNLAVADSEDADLIEAVDRYNSELETLSRMIDKRHIGSGIWYTSFYQTEAFGKFAEAAESIIEDFMQSYEW